MPKIEPKNKSVSDLTGIHLYHAGWSNCSMRVRMVLEEKGLEWSSHHLDTRAGEHITPDYFAIHPKGLVPTLVHNGDVWIESNDIICYLDDAYPDPVLTPDDDAGRELQQHWMALAAKIHVSAVKTYVYCARPKSKRNIPPQDSARYRQLQSDAELLEFHERNASGAGLSRKDCENAERLLHEAFTDLDAHLGDSRWLAGSRFSLADITWVPLQFTLQRAGFPFERHPNVNAWATAIAARPSFSNAVLRWFDGPPAVGDATRLSETKPERRI